MIHKYDKKEFEAHGFKLIDNNTMLHSLGHTITKINRYRYNVVFNYPKSYYYIALSYPYVIFGKVLDVISKFERYHSNPDRHNRNLHKTIC